MVTTDRIGGQSEPKSSDFIGLSTDIKPIRDDIPNGSLFIEMDTATGFFYDAEHKEWIEV